MIPSDLAARLRTLAEASFFDSEPPVQGTSKVREIQARLPQLLPGQQFTATLQRPLPDGTFQAIVAGRSYTLALSQAAKPGDTLELVVTKTTPRAVFAELAGTNPAALADPARPNLSPTGKLISFLLTGQPTPQAATLAGGKPILNAPAAASGAVLAPLLRQALAQSGLFYESHQLQWLSGKFDLAGLLREPQGQFSGFRSSGLAAPPPAPGAPSASASPSAGSASPAAQAGIARAGFNLPPIPGVSAVAESEGRAASAYESAQVAASRAAAIPDRLMPIVHQQLDGMASQHYVWHGQIWPGQNLEWEIDDPQGDGQGDDEAAREWDTTLRLKLPRLGNIEAQLHLTPAGVALRLLADDAATVASLDAARGQLDEALAAANVPLSGFVAEQRHGD